MSRPLILGSLALLLGLAAGGCTGSLEPVDPGAGGGGAGPDAGGGGGGTARAMFDSTVQPLLSECSGCHTGAPNTTPLKFLGNGGTTGYYDALTAQIAVVGNFDPASAEILTHGSHDGGAAPAWTTSQASTITAWLNAEKTARGL